MPIEKIHIVDLLGMVDENITKATFLKIEIVHLVQSSDHMAIEGHVASNDEHYYEDEQLNATTNNNDMECKTVHMVEAHVGAKKVLDFIIGKGSNSFFLYGVVASGAHLCYIA